MRTTVEERKEHERQFGASVASLGSGYQTDLMKFAHALCGDVEDTLTENARLQERVEEAVQRGCEVWNYMDMMLLPRMEGLAESLQASYAHTAALEALAERRKERLAVASIENHRYREHEDVWADCQHLTCANDRAAIEEGK